jgi:hypothetical protein
MPEDVERDLPPGGLLPARNLLDPGLFCQAVYYPELFLVLRCPELRPGKSHNWPRPAAPFIPSAFYRCF